MYYICLGYKWGIKFKFLNHMFKIDNPLVDWDNVLRQPYVLILGLVSRKSLQW